jgi:hypothetical protein
MISSNLGLAWDTIKNKVMGSMILSVSWNNDIFFIGTYPSGPFFSFDNGKNWRHMDFNSNYLPGITSPMACFKFIFN